MSEAGHGPELASFGLRVIVILAMPPELAVVELLAHIREAKQRRAPHGRLAHAHVARRAMGGN